MLCRRTGATRKPAVRRATTRGMRLVQECSISAMLAAPMPIGAGPIGMRMYYAITGGEVSAATSAVRAGA